MGLKKPDRVPILTPAPLAGGLGTQNPWAFFPALPFEVDLIPRRFSRAINRPVVSYALPALRPKGVSLTPLLTLLLNLRFFYRSTGWLWYQ
jgi:hypothetical protein